MNSVLLPTCRARGFGKKRAEKLNHMSWFKWLAWMNHLGVNVREDALWEWFISGYSVLQVLDRWRENERGAK